MPSTALLVDVGGSSVKAQWWGRGSPLGPAARIPARPDDLPACVEEAVRAAAVGNRDQRDEVVIALACFSQSLVGVDRTGRPVTEVVTYASPPPPRTEFTRMPDPERVGVPVPGHSAYALGHMLDLVGRHGETIWKFVTVSWLCLRRLAAQTNSLLEAPPPRISLSEAAWWGLWDHARRDWDENVPPHLLPKLPRVAWQDGDPVIPGHEFRGGGNGPLRGLVVAGAYSFADGAAAQMGSAPLGQLAVTVGTSSAVRVALVPTRDLAGVTRAGLFRYQVLENLVVVGGALNDGGNALDLAQRLFTGPALSTRQSTQLPIVLPFFTPGGERAPGWHGSAMPGAIVGLRQDHTPQDLQRAFVTGVCLRLRDVVNRMRACNVLREREHDAAWASGNALTWNPLWHATMADCLDCRILVRRARGEDADGGLETLLGLRVLLHMCKVLDPPPSAAAAEAAGETVQLSPRPLPEVAVAMSRLLEQQNRVMAALVSLLTSSARARARV